MKWRHPNISRWLGATRTADGTYCHVLIAENPDERAEGVRTLSEVVEQAHADALQEFRRLYAVSLDPLTPGMSAHTPPDSYPHGLHTSTLQGYLGEIIAGVVAENHDPHDITWTVPAFLFRAHEQAREALVRRFQLGGPARPIPGRTGDDCVAFALNDDGTVKAWLNAEAKCTHDHDSGLIAKGHAQLSSAITAPVNLYRIVDIVRTSSDPRDAAWTAPLELFLRGGSEAQRYDLFMYVCGRPPVRDTTWMTTNAAHAAYTRQGTLAAVEAHLDGFDEVLLASYPGHVINRA